MHFIKLKLILNAIIKLQSMKKKDTLINEKDNHDKIELRSDKVRKLLDDKPNELVRWGYVIITVICILLMLCLLFIEFPYGNGESILHHLFSDAS